MPAPSGGDPHDFLKIEVVLRKANTSEPAALGDQFALLVSSVVGYAIFMLDPEGTIVSWNEGGRSAHQRLRSR